MSRRLSWWAPLAVLTASTVGAGIFSLPFILKSAGVLAGAMLLIVLAAVVATAHTWYYNVLEREEKSRTIVSLARAHLGRAGSIVGFVSVAGGLLAVLTVFLMMGTRFVYLLFPFVGRGEALFLFWILSAVAFLERRREAVRVEKAVAAALGSIVVFLIAASFTFSPPPLAWEVVNIPLAFGPVLFALSGWTGVEPLRDELRARGTRAAAWKILFPGAFFVAALYFFFVVAVLRISPSVSPDTLSGISPASPGIAAALALFGALAVGMGYFPVGREMQRTLSAFFRLSPANANALVLFLPPALVLVTGANLTAAVGVAGGFFISTQYLLILAVCRAAGRFHGAKLFFWWLAAAVFALAITAEAYYLLG